MRNDEKTFARVDHEDVRPLRHSGPQADRNLALSEEKDWSA
jgi:hypothetical protein